MKEILRSHVIALKLSLPACYILFLCLFTLPEANAQAPIIDTTGLISGTSSNYGPIYRFSAGQLNNYSRHAYLYTAADLGIPVGAKIIKMEWRKSNTGGAITGNNNFNIWLSNTSATALVNNATWSSLSTGVTQVYSSTTFTLPSTTGTWIGDAFNFSQPNDTFVYTGGNLQILIDWAKLGTATGSVSFNHSAPGGVDLKSIGIAAASPIASTASLSSTTFGPNRPTIRITYVPVPPCTGIPFTGGVVASSTGACTGIPFTLNIANTISGSGVSYLWQRADNAAFTIGVTNLGTTASISTSQTSNKYYRCIATCATGPSSDTSAAFLMPMNPSYNCLCASSALSTSDEEIFNVTFASLNNSSNCSTLAPGFGSVAQMYSNYQGITAPPVERGSTVSFSVQIGNCNVPQNNRTAIFIDYNQNSVFTDPGEMVYNAPAAVNGSYTFSGTVVIPVTATLGYTAMRVINVETNPALTSAISCGTYSWGETEDYLIEITPTTICSGTPNPGNTIANASSVCSGGSINLSLQNILTGVGITYQWYKDGNVINGATSSSYTANGITALASFYCKVTCDSSGLLANSSLVNITLKPFIDCYCNSMAASDADDDIFEVIFNGSIVGYDCNTVAPGIGSILNRYSNYHPLGSISTVQQESSVPFSVEVNDCDEQPYYSFATSIWIDFNQNGSFSDAGEKVFVENVGLEGPRFVVGNITIPCDAKPGITGMRITEVEGLSGALISPCLSYSFGETEDYLINIIPRSTAVGYNFGTTIANASATGGMPFTNLTTTDITQGNNADTTQLTLLIGNTNPSSYSGASAQMNAGITVRNGNLQLTDSSAYFEMTYTPSAGYQVILDSISFGTKSLATGPTTIDVRTSLNNYASSIGTLSVAANDTWNYVTPLITSVTSSTPLTVRIYGYVAGGSGSITTGNSPANWFVDDIRCKVTVKCLPVCNLSATAANTAISCFGGTSTLTVTPSNGTGSINYSLNGSAPQASNIFTNLSAGVYTVSLTDDNACTATVVKTITQPAKLTSKITASACNTYTWNANNQSYTNSGTYTFSSLNGSGCAKYDTLILTINLSTSDAPINVSSCGSYTWSASNLTYTASGTYTKTSLNAGGCVHTQTLILIVTPSSTSTVNATACDSYTWSQNATTYTVSGMYQHIVACDTFKLNLSIIPNTNSSESITACDTYTWLLNNVTYTQSGIYTEVNTCHTTTLNLTLVTSTSNSLSETVCDEYTWALNNVTYTTSGTYTFINGCETTTLDLTVTPSTSSTSSATACDSYTWSLNNVTYTASGIYATLVGCHTTTLNLTIISSTTSTSSVTACDAYTWSLNNITYTAPGTYTFVDGCHTSTLNLTIVSSTTLTSSVTACDTYTWSANNNTYTVSGIYTFTSLNAASCVHTETLNLTIVSSTTSTSSVTACDTYTWSLNNTTYTASGTYTFVDGCHTSTLDLTIVSSTTSTSSVTTCDTYTWSLNNITYTASGTYTFVDGCHTSTLDLTITASTSSTSSVTACDTYNWALNNITYTASGTYTFVDGCHTSTLDLTITASTSSTSSVTACDTYNWALNNMTYTASGTYTFVDGCHTSTLDLTITASTSSTSSVTACDTYTWALNNITYTASGTYTFVDGCHTSTLDLTITASTSSTSSVTACDTYTWALNNITYTASGTYTFVDGCHTSTLDLTITASTSSTSSVTACDAYTWSLNNMTYTASGTYTFVDGCHTSTLDLTIVSSTTSTSSVTACDTYTWSANNNTYTVSGIYTFTSLNAASCIHTETLNLTIVSSTTSTSSVTACDTYTWSLNNMTYTASGTYTFVDGCHTSTLDLTINPSTTSTSSVTACDTYTWSLNNMTYTASGTYTFVDGCHTSTLDLTITASTSSTSSVTACDTYTWALNNMTYTTSGTYTFVDGCHTSTLDLTITESTTSTSSVTACDTYTWSLNNITYTALGTYTFVDGCHTSTLDLTIVSSTTSTSSVSACDTYTWSLNNITYTASGTYTFVDGCHTSTLDLTIVSSTTSTSSVTACDSYTWSLNNMTYTASGTYTFVDGCHTSTLDLTITASTSSTSSVTACDTYTWSLNNMTYTASGTYTFVDGCHTSTLDLTIVSSTTSTSSVTACDTYTWSLNNMTYTASGTYTFVDGCHTSTLDLTIVSSTTSTSSATACDSYTWSLNNITYTTSGTYTFVDGCHTSTLDLTITASTTSTSSVTACDSYTWSLNNIAYTTSGTYTYTDVNSVGCDSVISLSLTITSCATILNLKLFLQGYYEGNNLMRSVLLNEAVSLDATLVDTIDVIIYDQNAPYGLIASAKTILHTNGTAQCILPPLSGNYYIAIQHRNTLTSWSANPIALGNTPTTYDFTNASTQTYGANAIEVETGVWAFYTGDLNADENIDLLDAPYVELGIENFDFGYFPTDTNGDGNVDLLDIIIVETNISNFIFSIHP